MGATKSDMINSPNVIVTVDETGAITAEGWADDLKEQEKHIRALVRLNAGNPGFHCRKCAKWFTPQPKQLILHELCDDCFENFDNQEF